MHTITLVTIIALTIGNVYFLTKSYLRKQRRKKYKTGGYLKSKAKLENKEDVFKKQFDELNDRVDFLQVHLDRCVAWMDDVPTIKKETKAIKTNEGLKGFDNVVKMLKEDKKVKKPSKRPKRSKIFTEEQIDKELRKVQGTILFLTPAEYKRAFEKAYKRLYYKHITKKK